jgi:hypothetical protein
LSIRTGLLKPKALMLAAISAICFGECVRAFRLYGRNSAGDL